MTHSLPCWPNDPQVKDIWIREERVHNRTDSSVSRLKCKCPLSSPRVLIVGGGGLGQAADLRFIFALWEHLSRLSHILKLWIFWIKIGRLGSCPDLLLYPFGYVNQCTTASNVCGRHKKHEKWDTFTYAYWLKSKELLAIGWWISCRTKTKDRTQHRH